MVTTSRPRLGSVLLLYLYILTGGLRYWILGLTQSQVDIRTLSNAACKLHVFVVYWSVYFSSWTLASVSVERFLSVCFPLKAKQICSPEYAQRMLLTLAGILIILQIHVFWTLNLHPIPDGKSICSFVTEAENVWFWYNFAQKTVPFVIMLSCNMAIIVRLVVLQKRRRIQLNVTNQNTVKLTSLTLMLLTTNVMFLVTNIPNLIVNLLVGHSLTENPPRGCFAEIVLAIVIMIFYSNNAINFLLYCITGSAFRRELRVMLKRSRVQPER